MDTSLPRTKRRLTPISRCVLLQLLIAAILVAGLPGEALAIAWPVPGYTGLRRGVSAAHDAIDIAVPAGVEIKSACDGEVIRKLTCTEQHPGDIFHNRDCYGFGTGVVIRGDDGRFYQYAHMTPYSIPPQVYVGARVKKWDKLGLVGTTGCSTGPHLHFGIKQTDPQGGDYRSRSWYDPNPNGGTETYEWNPIVNPPNPPSGVHLGITEGGIGDIMNVGWTASAGATSYTVTLYSTSDPNRKQVKSAGGTSASFTVASGDTYKVSVVAHNSAGSSSASTSINSCVIHNNCTVTYKDYDGTLLATRSVKWGGNSTAPNSPTREGYTFKSWSSDGKGIKNNTTITAQYTINTYTVKFEDYAGNAIGSLQKIEYQSAATPPTNVPTKAGYVFVKWNTEEYQKVTKNLTVKAVYVWENVNLPIVTNITSARRNNEATGYVINVSMTNFPDNFTTGKVVTALKTKAGKLVASDTRSVSPTSAQDWNEEITILYSGVASTVEVSVVGVADDETTGTPKSKAVSKPIDLGEEWSEWSGNEPPTGSNIISESRTEYRYKDSKTIKDITRPQTPSGYTFISSTATGTYNSWGSWSGWSTTARSSNATTDVGTRTTRRIFCFACSNCGTHDDMGGACSHCGRNTLSWNEVWVESNPAAQEFGSSGRYRVTYNGSYWYYEKPGTANGLNNGTTGQVTRTEYRYRTRSQYYNYLYKMTNFSEWQPQAVSASSTREVETRTAYRFKTNSTEIPCYNYKHYKYQNLNTGKYVYTYTSAYANSQDYPGEWEYNTAYAELKTVATIDDGITVYGEGYGENSWYRADVNNESASTVYETTGSLEDSVGATRTVTGTAAGAAGKVATLIVYKGKNADPTASQIEYVGQTTVANDGSYTFDYVTKEEPTVKTGDFVITLGIEGATNYTNIGVIEAPKPSYVVEFVTEDGEQIGESQTVLEGSAATAPEPPEIEGYEFLNWDTGLSNVHDNMVITAQYQKKQYTVIFVDYDASELEVAKFAYGDELKAETIPTKMGEKFAKWVNKDGEEVTTVTDDMVVEASYVTGIYTVRFLDWDGSIISEQEVEAGASAEAPTLSGGPSEDEVFASWDSEGAEAYVMQEMTVRPVAVFKQTAASPTFSIESGTYAGTQVVSISTTEENAELFYDVEELADSCGDEDGNADGSTTGELAWLAYDGPITVSESSTVIAYAKVPRKNDSNSTALNIEIKDKVSVQGIALDKETLNLTVDDTAKLTATVTPENATEKGLTWSSSNEDAATVDADGKVTAIAAGEATITATAKDGSNVKATCVVTVSAPVVVKKDQVITATESYEKTVGDAVFKLDVVLTEGDGALSYESSDEAIADVDDKGNVTIGKAGTCVITVKAAETDAYNAASKTISITVNEAAIPVVLVSEITLNETELSMTVGDTASLAATVAPEDATNKTVNWRSSNDQVVSVDASGAVTAVGAGKAAILVSATDGSGAFAICNVEIAEPVIVKKDPVFTGTESYEKTEGDDAFNLDIALSEGDGALTYESSDPAVAAVDDAGKVTVGAEGTAVITVTSAETEAYNAGTKTVVVTVKKDETPAQDVKVTGITLDKDSVELTVGGSEQLNATVSPGDATNKTIIWTSANADIATVSATGLVEAKAVGIATIVAVAADGSGVATTCSVKVVAAAKADQVIEGTQRYDKKVGDDPFVLDAVVKIGNGALTYVSDKPEFATVDENGKVTPIAPGAAMITVTAAETDSYKASQPFIIVVSVAAAEVPDPPTPPAKTDINDFDASLSFTEDWYSYGLLVEPDVTVDGLKEGQDYTVTYAHNINVGKGEVRIAGINKYTGTKILYFTIKPVNITNSELELKKTTVTYTGKAIKPAITSYGMGNWVKLSDYTATYPKDCTNIGTKTVTITAKKTGNYVGSMKLTYIINPAKAAFKSIKPGSKSATVTLKAQKGGIKYQIQCRIGKGKWRTINTGKTKIAVNKLTGGKKYVFRVRVFKKVGSKTYYGAWSANKAVTIKK